VAPTAQVRVLSGTIRVGCSCVASRPGAFPDGKVAWENRLVPRRMLNPTMASWVFALALDLGGWFLAWFKTDIAPGLLITWLLAGAAIFAIGAGVITRRFIWWVTLILVLVEWGMLIAAIWPTEAWVCPSGPGCARPAMVWFGPALLTSPIVVIAFVGRLAGRSAGWVSGRVSGRASAGST
jgi:hypothetical protein